MTLLVTPSSLLGTVVASLSITQAPFTWYLYWYCPTGKSNDNLQLWASSWTVGSGYPDSDSAVPRQQPAPLSK